VPAADAVSEGLRVADGEAPPTLPAADTVGDKLCVADGERLGERLPDTVGVGVPDGDAPDVSDDVGDAVFDGVGGGVGGGVCEREPEGDTVALPVAVLDDDAPPSVGDRLGDLLGVPLVVTVGVAAGAASPVILKLSARIVDTVKMLVERRQQKAGAPDALAGSTPVDQPAAHTMPSERFATGCRKAAPSGA
jgi:hypothetical protein